MLITFLDHESGHFLEAGWLLNFLHFQLALHLFCNKTINDNIMRRPSVPSFVFAVLFISPFNVLRCAVFLIYFPQFGGSSYRLSEL